MVDPKNSKLKFAPFFIFFVSMVLSGCTSSPKIDPSFVAERWSRTLDAFNIDTVYPPRYMQPGDIFLVTEPKQNATTDENRYRRRSIRLGRADVSKYLKADAALNLQLPSTLETSPTQDIFTYPGKTVRLQSMGFTGFNISSVKESEIGLTSPIGILKSLFGFSNRNNLAMSISVPKAEHLEIPAYDAFIAFTEFCKIPSKIAKNQCRLEKNDALAMALTSIALDDDTLLKGDALNQNAATTRKMIETVPKIAFVTQVYYARQIDYYYGTNQGSAFNASAALIKEPDAVGPTSLSAQPSVTKDAVKAVSTSTPQPTSATTTTTTTTSTITPVGAAAPAPTSTSSGAATTTSGTPSKGTGDSTATDLAKAESLAAELQKRLDDIQSKLNGSEQGGMLRVIRATSEGTLLRQTFDTPVAIGFRALWWSPLDP